MARKVFPLKIAVIGAKGLPPKQGGIEHHCAELYTRLAAQGHRVDLYARSSYTQFSWYHRHWFEGVRVISLPSLPLAGVDAFVAGLLASLSAILQRYDIVHFHAIGLALFCWLPHWFTSARIIVTCHGLDWQRSKWGKLSSFLIYLGERVAVRYADEIIVVSEALQIYFWKTYGRETVYIRNAPATFIASDQARQYSHSLQLQPQRYIVFVGRLVPEKAPDLLVRAFQKLQPANWKLVLVGGSSDTPTYVGQLHQLINQNPNIVLTGQLLGARLAEIVRGAGLFVLPSYLEGMPLSLLEAMQEGIPVVVSDILPHQSLVGEDRGILFQTGDVESCVNNLNWAIYHFDEMQLKAKRAQSYVKSHYSWEANVADLLNLYRFVTGASSMLAEPVSSTHIGRSSFTISD